MNILITHVGFWSLELNMLKKIIPSKQINNKKLLSLRGSYIFTITCSWILFVEALAPIICSSVNWLLVFCLVYILDSISVEYWTPIFCPHNLFTRKATKEHDRDTKYNKMSVCIRMSIYYKDAIQYWAAHKSLNNCYMIQRNVQQLKHTQCTPTNNFKSISR